MKEYTHDGEPLAKALQRLRHEAPATLAGLAVCITGIAYRRRYYLDEICRL